MTIGMALYGDPRYPNEQFRFPDPFFSDATYTEIVKKGLVSTVDIAIMCADEDGLVTNECFWLASRCVKPAPGPFFLGGRWLASHGTSSQAASANMLRECGVSIDPQRFVPVWLACYRWGDCAQGQFPNRTNGLTHALVVNATERDAIGRGLTKTEYTPGYGLQPFGFNRLQGLMEGEFGHRVFLDVYHAVFPTQAERKARALQILHHRWRW